MNSLKENGSSLAPGFMFPEGIVIQFPQLGHRLKVTFDLDEVKWIVKKPYTHRVKWDEIDISHMLKADVLANVLSKDEQLTLNYPKSLVDIVKLYVADMEKEECYLSATELEIQSFRNGVFKFVKSQMDSQ